MNITSKRRLFAGAVAVSLVLAACGDDDDEQRHDQRQAAETARHDEWRRHTPLPTTGTGTTAATSGTTGTDDDRRRRWQRSVELAAGSVFVTGSSTVEPISARVGELALDQSGGELQVTVEGPGTGDGFDKFCNGEADISDASRPIDEEEVALCEENGIEYTELEIAIDGLSVITNPNNADVTCLDVPALYALIGPESEGFANWSDANDLATEARIGLHRASRRPARHLRAGHRERHLRHVRRVRHRRPRRGARSRRGLAIERSRRLHVERP